MGLDHTVGLSRRTGRRPRPPGGSASRRSSTRAWTPSAARLSASPSGLGTGPEDLPWHVQLSTHFGGRVHRDPQQHQRSDQDQSLVLPARRAGPGGPQFSSEASGLQPGPAKVVTGLQG